MLRLVRTHPYEYSPALGEIMPIVKMQRILDHALRNRYAVGYFEAWDLYSLEAALEAAEEARAPAILGFGADPD